MTRPHRAASLPYRIAATVVVLILLGVAARVHAEPAWELVASPNVAPTRPCDVAILWTGVR